MLKSLHVMRRRSQSGSVAVIVLAALIAGPVLVAALPGTSSGAASLPRLAACSSGVLVAWLDTQPNGAAGTIYYNLEFTNLSSHSCTLRGYPGVSALSLGGAQLGSAAVRVSTTPVKTITLGPGKPAISVLGIAEVGNFTASSCHPHAAAGLRVYAPNQVAAKTIPYPFAACSKPGNKYLSIQAVKLP